MAAPTMEKLGGRVSAWGSHPKAFRWSQTVPLPATKRNVPSHVLPEMPAPKRLVTGRWTSLCRDPGPSLLIWPPKEDPSPGTCLSLKYHLSTMYKIHLISCRWTRTGLGDSQRLHLDGRRPRSQSLLLGLVLWEVTSLDNQSPSILKTLTLSRQGLRWRESSLCGIHGLFRNGSSRPLAWGCCLPTSLPSVSEPQMPSEEAGAPQAVGLAQVGRQRAAHVLGGGADTLGCLHSSAQGLVELLELL